MCRPGISEGQFAMEREYFTQEEAESKIGNRIETKREFSPVPQGLTGMVVSVEPLDADEYTVAVKWNLSVEKLTIEQGEREGEPFVVLTGGKPLTDWFSREEYGRFLQEI
jgi:hypothetical protein